MRNYLFNTVAAVGHALIRLLQSIASGVGFIIGVVIGALIWFTATITSVLLKLIDNNQYVHANSALDQRGIKTELDILQAITKLKEDALARKVWTDDHSASLNELGSRLYHECNWTEPNIHNYMRNVVESLGLTYMAAGSDDDFDEGGIALD